MSNLPPKIQKTDSFISFNATCKHYVKRKKRFCKMTVAKGKEYCGEHLPVVSPSTGPSSESDGSDLSRKGRMCCPLDPKHTVYSRNLSKHLKICNAKPKDQPDYIVTNINGGSDDESDTDSPDSNLKLSQVSEDVLVELVGKINRIFEEYWIDDKITENYLNHSALKKEVARPDYSPETLKHIIQTSSILGHLTEMNLLHENLNYIEFGAGKGQVSYWLAHLVKDVPNTKVILVDKASHRHKKDNKIMDRELVQRIRADIGDFCIENFPFSTSADDSNPISVVGVSKHLCGSATDLAIRCIVNGNESNRNLKTIGFLIALCCHHRCNWSSFVGKTFFRDNQINQHEFLLISKMVSWAICGTGLSRERREQLVHQGKDDSPTTKSDDDAEATEELTVKNSNWTRSEKVQIGQRCKRLIDYARVLYLNENGYDAKLQYYVKSDVTLENVCVTGQLKS